MNYPALLLVHGAWHGPASWQPLIDHLPDVDVRTVDLPSSGDDPARLGDLYDDAAAIDAALEGVEGPVVVVGHSYGGCPVSQMTPSDRIVRVIYLTAIMHDAGESLMTLTGGAYPPYWDVREGQGTSGHFYVREPETVLYNGVEHGVAEWAAALGAQSLISVQQPLTRAAWRTVPSSTYIICETDNCIPLELQEAMAKAADRVRRLPSGHSPFLSDPAVLAHILKEEMSAP